MTLQTEYEQRIAVAVAGIVRDGEGRVLLVKHSEAKRGGFWFGKWICPGGRLEPGESLSEGVVREIKEETNLVARTSGDPIVFDRIVREHSKVRLHVVYVNFAIETIGGKLRAGSDAGIAKWFSREDLRGRCGELHEDTLRLLRKSGVLNEMA